MMLGDAELQRTTGALIAKGLLRIGSEADTEALGVKAHNHVLVLSEQRRTTIWPVTQMTRDEYGFCDTTLGAAGLAFWSLNLNDVAEIARPEIGSRLLMGGGSTKWPIGSLMRGSYPKFPVEVPENRRRLITQRSGRIQDYEASGEYGPEGLHITISGQVAVGEDEHCKPFSLDATIGWPTLTLKDIPFSVAYWKFGHPQGSPSTIDSPNRPRDSQKLSDLLISQGLSWPYLKGQISFTPDTPWPRPGLSAHDFVTIHFVNDGISFSDARNLLVLDTGFAWSFAETIRYFTLAMFDREKIEKTFSQQDAISMELAGDGLGKVRYRTGYAVDIADRLGWIDQTIKTMSLRMALGTEGLGISAIGQLNDFDPVEFAEHKQKRNSQLKPIRTYSLQASIPWALLVARGFGFAHKAANFLQAVGL